MDNKNSKKSRNKVSFPHDSTADNNSSVSPKNNQQNEDNCIKIIGFIPKKSNPSNADNKHKGKKQNTKFNYIFPSFYLILHLYI